MFAGNLHARFGVVDHVLSSSRPVLPCRSVGGPSEGNDPASGLQPRSRAVARWLRVTRLSDKSLRHNGAPPEPNAGDIPRPSHTAEALAADTGASAAIRVRVAA